MTRFVLFCLLATLVVSGCSTETERYSQADRASLAKLTNRFELANRQQVKIRTAFQMRDFSTARAALINAGYQYERARDQAERLEDEPAQDFFLDLVQLRASETDLLSDLVDAADDGDQAKVASIEERGREMQDRNVELFQSQDLKDLELGELSDEEIDSLTYEGEQP
ncbi:MAG: hypothetical protein J0H66_02610 [Solirubrobacterales bacterium]|nr:hypothetical protein [Solirubrobacterales bacterium]OJU95273.1 MAG: hypothetical protein BGO23_05270 [Solirubrobacterales bacterium 67-14]